MIRWVWFGFFFFFFVMVRAQDISNAYRLTWQQKEASETEITSVDLLTGFNAGGYNNQPAVKDHILYLSSSWKERPKNGTNIIALDLAKQEARMITGTPDKEFSPYPVGEKLYFIRVDEETGFQQLWKLEGKQLTKVLPESNVAYFMPVNDKRMAVILIENQNQALYIINLETYEKKLISRDVGRSLARGQNDILYFVHKYSAQSWYIKSFDPKTSRTSIICNTIKGSEDLFFSEDDHFWMAKDNRIYRIALEEALGNNWKNIFDLQEYGLNNIQRLCVIDGNNLIFINQ